MYTFRNKIAPYFIPPATNPITPSAMNNSFVEQGIPLVANVQKLKGLYEHILAEFP
jgi:hypothetical protein